MQNSLCLIQCLIHDPSWNVPTCKAHPLSFKLLQSFSWGWEVLSKLLNFSPSLHYLLPCNRSRSICKTAIVLASITPLDIACVQLHGSWLEPGARIISETCEEQVQLLTFNLNQDFNGLSMWPELCHIGEKVWSPSFLILIILISTKDYWSTMRESQIKGRQYRLHSILYEFFGCHMVCFDEVTSHLHFLQFPLPTQLCVSFLMKMQWHFFPMSPSSL